jgi:putative FmdB family regulatory protein
MPIYEYRCENGHTFEAIQRMSEDPLTSCEVCGAPVQKVLHAPAVHFKGSGFYTTDYGKKKTAGVNGKNGSGGSSESGAASESSSSSDSSGSSSSKSDSSGSPGSDKAKTASKSD